MSYLRIQKDESPRYPFLDVSYDGTVSSEEDIRVVNTCNMDVHKFPFDTQRCNITIGSSIHCGEGGSVRAMWRGCDVTCVWPSTRSSSSPLSWWSAAHSVFQLLPGNAIFPTDTEDPGRVGLPPADHHRLQFHPLWQNMGTAHLHCEHTQIQRDLNASVDAHESLCVWEGLMCDVLLRLQSAGLNLSVKQQLVMFQPPLEPSYL